MRDLGPLPSYSHAERDLAVIEDERGPMGTFEMWVEAAMNDDGECEGYAVSDAYDRTNWTTPESLAKKWNIDAHRVVTAAERVVDEILNR